jgi:protein O-GlcNAc transferase
MASSNPLSPAAYNDLGDRFLAAGEFEKAIAAYYECLKRAPATVGAALGLARASREVGKIEVAVKVLETSRRFNPQDIRILTTLGAALEEAGARQRAVETLLHALTLDANNFEAAFNLGNAYGHMRLFADAEKYFRQALDIRPGDRDALHSLANALSLQHRIEEAAVVFQRYLSIAADDNVTRGEAIFILDHIEGTDFSVHQAIRREWAARIANAVPAPARFFNDRTPGRRLRVGYVSADFRRHAAAFAFGAIFLNHDPEKIEIACYTASDYSDDMTGRLKRAAALWRPIAQLSDEAAAEMIRNDRIDILVDLSGHTEGNRLPMFALKPAPIQVSAFGSGAGTGLKAMDYLFSDPVAVPPEVRPLFAETIVDLPCFLPWSPFQEKYPPPACSPGQRGSFTVGCFNRAGKLSQRALGLWARILAAVPNSKLVLKDRGFDDEVVRNRVLGEFSTRGIEPMRISMLGPTSWYEYMAGFAMVDVALDPFPVNGGISTYEALWMGVPVVALLGCSMSGRTAAAILSAIGLKEWIAADEDEYLSITLRIVKDRQLLADMRSNLRERVAQSVIDPIPYTRTVEDAYRKMWHHYLDQVK